MNFAELHDLVGQHCFDGDSSFAKTLINSFPNLFIGFSGNITFVQKLESVVADVPLERILLETDGPYCAPRPLDKGTIATPEHIMLIALHISKLKNVPLDQVLKAARENTKKMFGI